MLTSSIIRSFLGWNNPLLPRVAHSLVSRHEQDRVVDMAEVRIVLPGGNAVRRLLELLTSEAECLGKMLFQPKIFTAGSLFEQVLPNTHMLVSEGGRLLAWIHALKSIENERLQILVAEIPEPSDFRAWLALAERIDGLHIEIAGAGLTFAEVATRGLELTSFLDEERWEVLDEVGQAFTEVLEAQGLVDDYSDRISRVRNAPATSLPGPLYLVGIAELNQNQRELLASIKSPVESFIFAPPEEEGGFDEFGCVRSEQWCERTVAIEQDSITIVESPRDVVGRFVQEITRMSEGLSLSDIAIGLGDESESNYFKGSLRAAGVPVRAAGGTRFSATVLGSYLRGLLQYLSSKTFVHFAAIIKHPYQQKLLSSVLNRQTMIASCIDRYQEHHFQATISRRLPNENAHDQQFIELVSAFHEFLGDFLGPGLKLSDWIPHLRNLLDTLIPVIGNDDLPVIEELKDIVEGLADSDPVAELRGSEALLLLLHLADSQISVPDADSLAVELLGWLELALDDAPALLLTSLDESIVPAVINADPFLPNTLRRHLGLTDNARRFGRDLFLFTTLLHSKSSLSISLARRKLDGSPRFPSRLLLSCLPHELPERITYLYQEGKRFLLGSINQEKPSGARWNLTEPKGFEGQIPSMSVTSFKDYLNCPYRFFLKHVQKTREHPGTLFELDALNFGTLTHLVLDRFTKDPVATSHSGTAIFEVMNRIVTAIVAQRFGTHEYPAIRVQLEQLRERLRALALWQAEQNREGWKIHAVEYVIDPAVYSLQHNTGSMGLRGRIDRIDYHARSNQYRIIDYKTADAGQNLEYVYKKKQWLDLQMPLYFYAIRDLYPESELSFFYCNVSASTIREQLIQVGQSLSELEEGIEQARGIAEKVATGVFWPPTSKSQQDSFDWLIGSLETDDSESDEEGVHE